MKWWNLRCDGWGVASGDFHDAYQGRVEAEVTSGTRWITVATCLNILG